ncbi:ribosome recycling factor [Candidatus Falkowbacteria bacterium]|jgi:ribosome recycling factor|nr:ribosome recycling factor [Candidatus Falkowbacteria bacterium]MBT4433294.1 ribosome recycling factor [Candidatus Falkowbacteria bacterium]
MIDSYKENFDKEIDRLKDELTKIRTGRATPALLQNIIVEAYEARTPLPQLANISAPEPRTLVVQPWDKSVTKEIEKAIASSDLGASVKNDGEILRITLPLLTEENRQKLVKLVGEKMEQARIAMRIVRDKVKDEIKEQENAKELTEDDKYRLIEELDLKIKEYNKKIEEIGKAKEEEIMTI